MSLKLRIIEKRKKGGSTQKCDREFENSLFQAIQAAYTSLLLEVYLHEVGPYAPNKKGAPKGELTLRTSVITHGSKGELALRGTFLFGAHGP